METPESTSVQKKIGIIGAGQGGKELLSLFSGSRHVAIAYIVDHNADAPGLLLAKKLGIKTLSKVEAAIKSEAVDFVLNTTGSEQVTELIRSIALGVEIINGDTALMMFHVMEEGRREVTKQVGSDLSGIRQEIDSSTRDVSKTLHGINKISNELEVLAINAGIQASRAAQFGKGFAVVAGEVKATARVARGLAGDIERVINEISSLSGKIEQSLKKIM